jgi:hypothetical protein
MFSTTDGNIFIRGASKNVWRANKDSNFLGNYHIEWKYSLTCSSLHSTFTRTSRDLLVLKVFCSVAWHQKNSTCRTSEAFLLLSSGVLTVFIKWQANLLLENVKVNLGTKDFRRWLLKGPEPGRRSPWLFNTSKNLRLSICIRSHEMRSKPSRC